MVTVAMTTHRRQTTVRGSDPTNRPVRPSRRSRGVVADFNFDYHFFVDEPMAVVAGAFDEKVRAGDVRFVYRVRLHGASGFADRSNLYVRYCVDLHPGSHRLFLATLRPCPVSFSFSLPPRQRGDRPEIRHWPAGRSSRSAAKGFTISITASKSTPRAPATIWTNVMKTKTFLASYSCLTLTVTLMTVVWYGTEGQANSVAISYIPSIISIYTSISFILMKYVWKHTNFGKPYLRGIDGVSSLFIQWKYPGRFCWSKSARWIGGGGSGRWPTAS